ncbi:chorismate mutase [Sphaerisporangium perillae]|uniref:chorismate mutase n=1 Tax=Sphaerisporangium perillae TaxID=2935860 RepID=UPI0035584100
MSSTGQPGAHSVRIGSLTVGEGPAVLLAGAFAGGQGADGRWLSLRDDHAPSGVTDGPAGTARDGGESAILARARAGWDGPLLVEPASAGVLPAVAAHADAVVLGPSWAGDPELLRAACALGLPVVLRRGAATSLEEWLRAADRCADDGAAGVVLCESGSRKGAPGPAADLGLVRAAGRRSGRPVLASPGDDAGLAGAVVAAGADGLWLGPEAGPEAVEAAREAVTLIGALVRDERPGTLTGAREAIDRVDAALAVLLERRAFLAGTVQRLKPVGGFAGRDMERERRLVAAMARRAPELGQERLAPIMNAVIEAGLHLAEERKEAGAHLTEEHGGDTRENGAKPTSDGVPPGSVESVPRGQAGMEALAGRGPDHD